MSDSNLNLSMAYQNMEITQNLIVLSLGGVILVASVGLTICIGVYLNWKMNQNIKKWAEWTLNHAKINDEAFNTIAEKGVFLSEQVSELKKVVDNHDIWIAEFENAEAEEKEKEHQRLSEQGKKGVEIREDNKEAMDAAINEGRQVLSEQTSNLEKLNQLKELIKKYPTVAQTVAKKLNREFGISKAFGISEGTLIEEVAKIVLSLEKAPLQATPKEKGFFL